MVRMTEISKAQQKSGTVFFLSLIFLVSVVLFTLYKWFFLGIKQPVELFFGLMLIFVLWERAQSKYTYEAHENRIRIIKHGLLRNRELDIPYKSIFGIYLYKPQLISAIGYRKTFRMHSSLDRNTVWTLAYEAEKDKKGKPVLYRVFFKPSEELLALFEEKLPGKVIRKSEGKQ